LLGSRVNGQEGKGKMPSAESGVEPEQVEAGDDIPF
jgi:hypothetical protein